MPRSLWLLALLLLFRGPADATCGGGGGGGSGKGGSGQAYHTTWTGKTWEASLAEAAGKKQGLVLYFPPAEEGGKSNAEKDDAKKEHRFFSTKIPNDASKERTFYKAEGEAAKKLREQYEAKPDVHVIHVCDGYGNSYKVFRNTDSSKVDGKSLEATLYNMERLSNRLARKLDAQADAAEKAVNASAWRPAIEGLSELLVYRGHPPVERAKALLVRVEAAGDAAVDDALKIEDPAARTKRLQEIRKTFAGTKVEHRCKVELGETPREAPAPKDAPAAGGALVRADGLAGEAWSEHFAGVDFAAMPPSIAEQTEAALREGIALEQAGRYEEAKKRYELACSLDPKDPVPLVHLGEVYRHHIGDWDAAEEVMKHALALDSDDFAMAIALHGLGKMTIWRGDDKGGLALLERSIARYPTPLCYRNLAIYWTGDKTSRKGIEYAEKAYALDPDDGYNQVFYSIYLLLDGRRDEAAQLFAKAKFDASMSYNVACYHAVKGDREKMLEYLKRHFYEYEQFEAVRSFEMAEARMDALFAPWYEDKDFKELTAKARTTPWLGGH